MILAGAGVACTFLLLIGLYFVGREFRNLARRLDAGLSAVPGNREATDLVDVIRSGKNTPDQVSPVPTGRSVRDDMLFARDRSDTSQDFAGRSPQESLHASRSGSSAAPSDAPAPWQDELTRPRSSTSATDTSESGSPSSQRQRRNLLFSSKRREQTPREQDAHEESSADQLPTQHQPAEDSSG